MALRNRPYLPLYVQDFLTDEKLSECSAESTGVYIRLMCLMHKSESYGAILLKQKDKQTGKQITDFAIKLARQMPYDTDTIERSLTELLEENVITIDGDVMFQKRMVKDGKLSDTRASAGSKGGVKKSKEEFASGFATGFATAKPVANTEIEIEIESEDDIKKDSTTSRVKKSIKPFPPDHNAYRSAVYLDNHIRKRMPSQKPSDERRLQSWADAFDKCHRLDGQSWSDISVVLKFSQSDPFWQQNILSGEKFREKYVQLLAKMQGQSVAHVPASSVMSDLQQLHQQFGEEDS